MAALFETARECGHGVDVPGAGKTECSDPRHWFTILRVNLGPR
jgi:hypothetical protein